MAWRIDSIVSMATGIRLFHLISHIIIKVFGGETQEYGTSGGEALLISGFYFALWWRTVCLVEFVLESRLPGIVRYCKPS
ncbi:MAG: hypothetical protein N0E48_24885 [Candidatus Thiodiazotropha endolucinida]|nr:hypothetical protein [Candidatus Thiodiazotropha taylori]MCW4346562.1 hypothetical protein [Candidatus Thiodiazotropha endolucinida]